MINHEKEEGERSSCLGVLQPITSLVSTISLVKPVHRGQLLGKLVSPPLDDCGSGNVVSVSLKSRCLSRERGRKNASTSRAVPVSARDDCERTRNVVCAPSVSSTGGRASSGLHGDRCSGEMGAASGEHETELKGEEKRDGFASKIASDVELYLGLQLLFRKRPRNGENSLNYQHTAAQ